MFSYIKIAGVYKKLKLAEEEKRIAYIGAPAGCGKTAAVNYFYRKTPYKYISCLDGDISDLQNIDLIGESVVIIDDISRLFDPVSQEYVKALLLSNKKQVVLVGRTVLPRWLQVISLQNSFIYIDDNDLLFKKEHVIKLFETRSISFKEDLVEQILSDTRGYAVEILTIARYLEVGLPYDEQTRFRVSLDVMGYLNEVVYERWDHRVRNFALAMCNFDYFTSEMVEIVTGDNEADKLLSHLIEASNFIFLYPNNTYGMRPKVKKWLEIKSKQETSKEFKQDIANRAGIYYELKNDINTALYYFNKADNKEKIVQMLVKNSERHVGTGHYYETKEYYFALPESIIEKTPVLMSGMSMLYSILFLPEDSEKWYDKLKEFEAKEPRGSMLRKEAKARLAYLDIGLPHRGSSGLIAVFQNLFTLSLNKEVNVPELSVTSNMPSLMSGGKDFCNWSKHDKELALSIGKAIELCLKKYGVGLVNAALAESGLEKGTIDDYEALTLLNRAYTMADMGGKIEICFVASALMAKIHIQNNKLPIARSIIEDFRSKAIKEEALMMLNNIDAFLVWLDLFDNKRIRIEKWLEEAPNENTSFNILERYRYLMKVRAYISVDQLEAALNLTERLAIYFEQYDRVYHQIENLVLQSIISHRLNSDRWKIYLENAVSIASEYHFISVVAREGIAVLPLLESLKTEIDFKSKECRINEKYFSKLILMTKKISYYYPDYLKSVKFMNEPLTEMEKRILTLLCRGIAGKEICDICGISYNTLKFHNRNIYKKLGVENRQGAEKMAKLYGI